MAFLVGSIMPKQYQFL